MDGTESTSPTVAVAASTAPRPAAAAGQVAKLREANAKYKNLLKMAKERIQEQEGVLEERRCEYISLWVIVESIHIVWGFCVVLFV